jgi:alkanesulfonate monooxygenase SsuD/methylene tetrahydromethanopterin reductase-like flavin-dependent oxidoreductase (luciferase family)
MHVGYGAAFQHRQDDAEDLFMRRELEFCIQAESLGFDSVWLTEHHFSDYSLVPDPLEVLAYLAGRTEHVKLGTAVIVLPWHDPVRVAEKVLLLDHLSDGRAVIGLGRGLSSAEYEGMRVPQDQSRPRFKEYAQLLREALETGIIEGGELINQPRRELRPAPFKSFKGRLFSASVSPDSASVMAELALGLMFIIVKPIELIRADLDRYREAWHRLYGTKSQPTKPILSAVVAVDESGDRALELATRYGRASHQVAVRHYGMDDPAFGSAKGYEYYRQLRATPGQTVDQAPSTVIYGTPDRVLERLDEFKRALDLQAIFMIFHGMPYDDGARSLQCFVNHCLPELKTWPVVSSFDEVEVA